MARDGLLQVRIEHLIGVQLGTIAGQVEHLDVRLVLLQSRLHGLGVVHLQVLQHQEYFGAIFFPVLPYQPFHEVDQDGRIYAPSKLLKRTFPRLVTLEMMDRHSRRWLTRISGVWPIGA